MRYSDTCMQDSAKNNEVSEFWGLPKAWTFVMRTLSSLAMTYTEYPTHLHKLSARPTQMDARGTAEHDVRCGMCSTGAAVRPSQVCCTRMHERVSR